MSGHDTQIRRHGYTRAPVGQSAPMATVGVRGDVGTGVSVDIGTGNLSLALIGGAVVGMVAFYLWTRSVQGG